MLKCSADKGQCPSPNSCASTTAFFFIVVVAVAWEWEVMQELKKVADDDWVGVGGGCGQRSTEHRLVVPESYAWCKHLSPKQSHRCWVWMPIAWFLQCLYTNWRVPVVLLIPNPHLPPIEPCPTQESHPTAQLPVCVAGRPKWREHNEHPFP